MKSYFKREILNGGGYIKEEKSYIKIPYMAIFTEKFVVDDTTEILLDSIKIYGVTHTQQLGNVITQDVDFYVKTVNDKISIYPVTPYDSYYLITNMAIEATKVLIEASDFNNCFLSKKESGENKMFNSSLPKTNSSPQMPSVQTSNGRNCRDCSKVNVCKYQEVVIAEVERLIGELEDKELPLSVDINCNEFLHKNSGNVR